MARTFNVYRITIDNDCLVICAASGGDERREKRGRGAGYPRGRRPGEIGKNYAALHNILQIIILEKSRGKSY